jgi:hypothetical protein
MGDAAVISIAELRVAVGRLLDAAEKRFGPRVELDADYYWSIFPSDAFNMESEPPVLTGQLTDDVETIRDVLQRADPDEDELLLWHGLDHLTGILQRISHLAGA